MTDLERWHYWAECVYEGPVRSGFVAMSPRAAYCRVLTEIVVSFACIPEEVHTDVFVDGERVATVTDNAGALIRLHVRLKPNAELVVTCERLQRIRPHEPLYCRAVFRWYDEVVDKPECPECSCVVDGKS